jgi:hypothetical protein
MLLAAGVPGVVLVEGPFDKRLLKRFVKPGIEIEECRGRPATLEVGRILRERGCVNVLTVIDFDIALSGANLIACWEPDVEFELVNSGLFERVAAEVFSEIKVCRRFDDGFRGLRKFFVGQARLLGALRVLSHERQMGLPFDHLDFGRIVDRVTCTVNIEKAVATLLQQQGKSLSEAATLTAKCQLSSLVPGYVRGKDILEIMARGAIQAFGTKATDAEELGRLFSVALDREHFATLPVFSAIQKVSAELGSDFFVLGDDTDMSLSTQGAVHRMNLKTSWP